MMNWENGGMMGGSGFGVFEALFGLMFTLSFIVGSILLVVWIVKQFTPGGTSTPVSSSNALEILNERLAKGRINKEEFVDLKKELMK